MANGLFNLKQVMQGIQQGGWNSQKPPQVEYLVVAGGGGGGSANTGNGGGGGGAGGLLAGIDPVPNGQTLLVTVGAAGSGTTAGGSGQTNGGNSVFGSIVALGGGYGGNGYNGLTTPASGGSGGGGGASTSYPLFGGDGRAGQGNRGGAGSNTSGYNGGGGGGAGTIGLDFRGGKAGNGGAGAASAISGTVTAYAGGGGGGAYNTAQGGTGGTGGGGTGGNNTTGTAGAQNTGGGGGGAGGTASSSNGGTGIVIISYPDVYAAPTAVTGGPTVSTSGSGSMSFNGSNQVIVYNANSAFQFGTGNFTWETWVYFGGGGGTFFDLGSANSAGSFAVFATGGVIYVRIDGSSNDLTYTYPGGFVNSWVHLAVVRNSSTMTLYYNGVSVATGTRTNNLTQQTPYIGNLNGFTSYYLGGYLSNTRVVKGTAVYTGNFTPSTTPLAAVSGTSLLLNSVSGAYLADGSTNAFTPVTGTVAPAWNASSPFTVTGYKNRVYTWTTSGSITF